MDANGYADFTRAGGSATPSSRRPLAFFWGTQAAEQLSVPALCSHEQPMEAKNRIVRGQTLKSIKRNNGTWTIIPGKAIGR